MTLEQCYNRFKNLLEVKNECCLQEINANFVEHDLKSIINYLGELKALHEHYSGSLDEKLDYIRCILEDCLDRPDAAVIKIKEVLRDGIGTSN